MSLFGTSWDDPKTAAIMGLAGGLLQGNAGAGLQQGLLGYQRQAQINNQTARQAKYDAREDEEFALKKSEAQRKLDRDKVQRDALKQAAMDLMAGTFNPAKFAGVLPTETLKNFMEMPQWGRSGEEVARTVKGMGPDGREYEYQVNKYGQRVGEGFAQFKAPLMQDLGGQVAALDPYTLKPQAQFGKTMTPDGRAADARGWAANDLARQRLEMDRGQGQYQFNAELGGYVPKAPGGAFVPLPGADKAAKPPTEGQGKALLFGSRMAATNKIFDELEKKGYTTPSYFKAGMESVPVVGGALGNLANVTPFVSKQEQQLEQAQRDFINAVLRRESGAVISPEEFENAKRQYFPQFGEPKEVIEQKKKNRELATRGILYEAGPHASKLNQPTPEGRDLLDAADAILKGGR